MSDEPVPPADDHGDRDTVDVRPFAVAAAVFVVVAVLAVAFLREDAGLAVVAPDTFERVGATTVRAVASSYETTGCEVIERAQFELDDDTVFVEFVVSETDDCVGGDAALSATITLPEPIGERRLVGGPGRRELPCERDPGELSFTCGQDG